MGIGFDVLEALAAVFGKAEAQVRVNRAAGFANPGTVIGVIAGVEQGFDPGDAG